MEDFAQYFNAPYPSEVNPPRLQGELALEIKSFEVAA